MAISRRKITWIALPAILLIAAAAAVWYWQKQHSTVNEHNRQVLTPVVSTDNISKEYDVIVAGTDPEGITAAISAARNNLKVLLVDGRDRDILGGLITLGWLNSLDLNESPVEPAIPGQLNFLDKGIFQEWYDQLEGTSVDTTSAANVFYSMVKDEPNIDLLLKTQSMKPLTEAGTDGHTAVTGLEVVLADGTKQEMRAKAVIDATQDGDIAAAAGAPYTIGHEDLGDPDAQMAVTLVFKMSGVTQEVWDSFKRRTDGTNIDKMSAWGFGAAKYYKSTDPERVGLRGLNIGRQNDETILINAMHIFGIDPLNPESIKKAFAIGQKEAPLIVEHLTSTFPELKGLKFAGTAPELYVRETRHMIGEYRLTTADLMENRDHWDAIAYGSYEVDIQRTSNADHGAVAMVPKQYGVPFRALVPKKVDGLVVVGRAASFDTIPHGSARVIPLGMATGEAAGAAAKLAIEKGVSFRELSQSKEDIAELRELLTKQGMDLKMNSFEKPAYTQHKDYPGLLAAVSMYVAIGGYDNDRWQLDADSNAKRFMNNMLRVHKVHRSAFPGDPSVSVNKLDKPEEQPLTLAQAALTICDASNIKSTLAGAVNELTSRGWLKQETIDGIKDKNKLTNGNAFMIIRDIVEYQAGVVYQ
ncbi:FAD-dependent oxidoreductase [Paenibacillus sp. GCM10023252]|uniref:FAD-dependent oxidoreductase n=1 Tax=Paenibacillus sp. GCM10023252 TaxID=3252649 RepID=UPI003615B4FB